MRYTTKSLFINLGILFLANAKLFLFFIVQIDFDANLSKCQRISSPKDSGSGRVEEANHIHLGDTIAPPTPRKVSGTLVRCCRIKISIHF